MAQAQTRPGAERGLEDVPRLRRPTPSENSGDEDEAESLYMYDDSEEMELDGIEALFSQGEHASNNEDDPAENDTGTTAAETGDHGTPARDGSRSQPRDGSAESDSVNQNPPDDSSTTTRHDDRTISAGVTEKKGRRRSRKRKRYRPYGNITELEVHIHARTAQVRNYMMATKQDGCEEPLSEGEP